MASLKQMFQRVKGSIGDEVAYDVFKESLRFVVKKASEKAAKKAGEAIEQKGEAIKYAAEHRDEFIAEIMMLDDRERTTWMHYLRIRMNRLPRPYGDNRPYRWNDENTLVERIMSLRKHLLEEPEGTENSMTKANLRERREIWRKTLETLAHMEPEEFDLTVEALTHDVVAQYLYMVREWISKGWEKINQGAGSATEVLKEYNAKLDNSLTARLSRGPFGLFFDPFGIFRS